MWWTILLIVLLAVVVALLIFRATRIDRLHNDVLHSRATLERLLHSRAALARELAAVGGMDPAASMILADAASRSLDVANELVPDGLDTGFVTDPALGAIETRDRALVESELSRVLREVLPEVDGPEGIELRDRIVRGWQQMTVARSVHNQKVAHTRQLRVRWLVRVFRLAGRATMPVTFDMDDDLPEGI